jgi:hypothetical protein
MAHKDKDKQRDSAGAHEARADDARGDAEDTGPRTLTTAVYDRELAASQIELVKLQE